MPSFSARSRARLETCDPKLQALFEEVIRHWDCTILEGRRDQATQDEYHRTGRSKVKWPNSKHNATAPALSRAVDCAPYPIDWEDHKRFIHFAGFVLGVASTMGIKIRLGADWNGDHRFTERFFDAPHFELIE